MKTIELKQLKKDDFKLGYREQLLACVRAPLAGERGMDVEEMRKSIRIIEALEKTKPGDWLDLEDADYEHLKQKVAAMRWNFAHQLIVQFVDDVNAAIVAKKQALGESKGKS